ncbi:MAG: glycosyltransferase family A protein [Pseudomonadota bacterium]|nr:glycosyltransferase family A protein [Pseudomonadota bacterium]
MTRMPETPPRVSVIIPAYNAAWCVARALDSVLAQTWRDFELIVVDDGSRDGTSEILAGYGAAVRVVVKTNGGLSSARNAGIAAARGEYVAFLDADDWWLPEKLERQMALLDSRPSLLFCSTTTLVFTPEGRRLADWRCHAEERPALQCIFAANAHVAGSGSAVMARREAFTRAGGFDESLRSLEDIDMWMRLAALGDYACLDDPLTAIEKRGDSMSGNLDVMRAAAIRVMRKNRRLLPPTLRGGFWRSAYAAMLSDYAKWAYRKGHAARAAGDLLHALLLAPLSRGRRSLGLLLAVVTRQKL